MSLRLLTSMSAFWVVTALGLAPSPASAQTTGALTVVTGSQATQLVDKDNNPVTHDFVSDQPFWVNLAECKLGWKYQISLTSSAGAGATMEVWAGSSSGDCSTLAARFGSGGTTASCWRVEYTGLNDGNNVVYIPVQRVVGQHFIGDSASRTVPLATEDDCQRVANSNIPSAGQAITLFFYVFGGGVSGTPTYTATWTAGGYDLIGPPAPATVTTRPADSELYVNWSQVSMSDLAGYHVYCRQPDGNSAIDAGVTGTGGTAGTSTGGASSTGGADAAGGTAAAGESSISDAGVNYNPSCIDGILRMGNLPSADMRLVGTASDKLATSAIASGLENGKGFACAVSAYDTRKNDGPLSMVKCGTPWWVDDFFSTYRSSGGKAGGGFCNIGFGHSRAWYLIPLASILMLALRRRRSQS